MSLMLMKNLGINHLDFDFCLKFDRYLAKDSFSAFLAVQALPLVMRRSYKGSAPDQSVLHMSNYDYHH